MRALGEEEKNLDARRMRFLQEDEARCADACNWVEEIFRATLVAGGCHRHHRGEWRRRRGMDRSALVKAAEQVVEPRLEDQGTRSVGVVSEVETASVAADGSGGPGDQIGTPAGRPVPEAVVRIPLPGPWNDVRRRTENALIAWMSADPAVRHSACLRLEILRRRLGGEAATPLERLLVDRIVICHAEVLACDARLVATPYSREDRAYITALERRRGRAHRRYLAAVKALAVTRKLLGVPGAGLPPNLPPDTPPGPPPSPIATTA
jgi:hypothetical protein